MNNEIRQVNANALIVPPKGRLRATVPKPSAGASDSAQSKASPQPPAANAGDAIDKWANVTSTVAQDAVLNQGAAASIGFDRNEFIDQIKMQLAENPDLSQFRPRVSNIVDGRPVGGEILGNGIAIHFSTHPMGQDGATFERIAQAIVARAYAEIVSCPDHYSDEYLRDIERAIDCLGDFVVKANAARAKQFPI